MRRKKLLAESQSPSFPESLPRLLGPALPNRMMPGGGNTQAIPGRNPGAPNGMCEYLVAGLDMLLFCSMESDL